MCVPVCEHVAWHLSGSQRTICRSHFSYSPLSGFQGLNSAHEDWQQEPLLAEPSWPGHRVLCSDTWHTSDLFPLWVGEAALGLTEVFYEKTLSSGVITEKPLVTTLTKLNSINVFVIVTCLYLESSGATAIQIARRQRGKLSGPLYLPRDLMCLGATFEMVLFWILSLCFKRCGDKQTSHLCFLPSLESRQGCPEWISRVRNHRSMKW